MNARRAVVTGGTDGIGAATALELRRRGADVVIVGRSVQKAGLVVDRAAEIACPGSIRAITTDLSLMSNVVAVGRRLADELGQVDLLLGAAGVLLTRAEFTREGLEKDLAVSYLSRFALLETLSGRGALTDSSRVILVAASSPTLPSFARMEFDDIGAVRARTGMASHGQAQLANDLLVAQAGRRYGVTAIGYGPGAVDTSIRRDIPRVVRAVMHPFYARRTRSAAEVGAELADIFADPTLAPGRSHFFDRRGSFTPSPFVSDALRQRQLLDTSTALLRAALTGGDEATAAGE